MLEVSNGEDSLCDYTSTGPVVPNFDFIGRSPTSPLTYKDIRQEVACGSF